jgi:predicted  nucleic acid-binding Zn-ribbon protein
MAMPRMNGKRSQDSLSESCTGPPKHPHSRLQMIFKSSFESWRILELFSTLLARLYQNCFRSGCGRLDCRDQRIYTMTRTPVTDRRRSGPPPRTPRKFEEWERGIVQSLQTALTEDTFDNLIEYLAHRESILCRRVDESFEHYNTILKPLTEDVKEERAARNKDMQKIHARLNSVEMAQGDLDTGHGQRINSLENENTKLKGQLDKMEKELRDFGSLKSNVEVLEDQMIGNIEAIQTQATMSLQIEYDGLLQAKKNLEAEVKRLREAKESLEAEVKRLREESTKYLNIAMKAFHTISAIQKEVSPGAH